MPVAKPAAVPGLAASERVNATANTTPVAFDASQVDVRPVVTRRVDPALPAGSSPAPGHVVVLRVLVDTSGRVADVQVARRSPTDRTFDNAAVAAVRQWTFSPALRRNAPVNCWVYVGVSFDRPGT